MKALLLSGLLAVALAGSVDAAGTIGKVGPDGTVTPMQCWCLPPIGGKVLCVCVQ